MFVLKVYNSSPLNYTLHLIRRWQERVSILLDMYGVAMALSTSKPDVSSAKQVEDWTYANKVC